MTNPCRRHFQRVTAALAAAAVAGPDQTMEGLNAYEQQLAKLTQDRLRLSGIQSTEGKIKLKEQLLPEYAPYIEGVLSAGLGAQDEVVTTVMVWRIDTGDYAGALDIASYVLQHKLVMPDRFERTTGCLIAEEIAEGALKAMRADQAFDLELLHRTALATDAEDMPDQARAKLVLATARATVAGLTVENPGKPDQVQAGIDLFRRAIELHDNCGGKTDLKTAEALLKKIAGQAS
ncbi:terminase endonuclease subunit [Pseudomonas sp. PS02288]|uniref:phage terminase small subunit n=1 Tax=Pseudomonas sp. PS02288 TaxID=2991443 RepID=UPI00249A852F|nr:terminase endonuclease subunit [Pseudomonas sp. PS02288]